jgi:hypothetical protein
MRGWRQLRVVLWDHLKDLRATARELSGYGGWRSCAGCYLATRAPREFGQIHLWKKILGGGYFAHELQHFLADYSMETESYPLDTDANERMAFLAGDLTMQFWNQFYDRFDGK